MPRFLLRRKLLVLCSACLFLLPAAVSHSWSYIDTYKQNVNMAGGTWGTYSPAYRDRAFNRVYHQYGTDWQMFYARPDGSELGHNIGYINPLYANGSATNAKALCHNIDDQSGVTWTCQATVP